VKSLTRHGSLRASEKDPNLKSEKVTAEQLRTGGEFKSEQIIPTGTDLFKKKKTFKSDMDLVNSEFSGKNESGKARISNKAIDSDKGSKKTGFLESGKGVEAPKRKSEGDLGNLLKFDAERNGAKSTVPFDRADTTEQQDLEIKVPG
jgi:hypothetical protein